MSLKKIFISVIIIWAIAVLFELSLGWIWWKLEGFPWGETLQELTDGILLPWLFLEAFVFVLIFAQFRKGIPGTSTKKGLLYGFVIWLISSFLVITPQIISSPLDTYYSKFLIFSTVSVLALSLIKGLIVGIIFREK